MRIAYLDCFSGISGDMFLGALMDAGVPAKLFEDTVSALNVSARLEISRVDRSVISPTKDKLITHGNKDTPRTPGKTADPHEYEHSGAHGNFHDNQNKH